MRAFKCARLSFQKLTARSPYYFGALCWHGDEVTLGKSVSFMKLLLAVVCMNDTNIMLFPIIIESRLIFISGFLLKINRVQIHPGY